MRDTFITCKFLRMTWHHYHHITLSLMLCWMDKYTICANLLTECATGFSHGWLLLSLPVRWCWLTVNMNSQRFCTFFTPHQWKDFWKFAFQFMISAFYWYYSSIGVIWLFILQLVGNFADHKAWGTPNFRKQEIIALSLTQSSKRKRDRYLVVTQDHALKKNNQENAFYAIHFRYPVHYCQAELSCHWADPSLVWSAPQLQLWSLYI